MTTLEQKKSKFYIHKTLNGSEGSTEITLKVNTMGTIDTMTALLSIVNDVIGLIESKDKSLIEGSFTPIIGTSGGSRGIGPDKTPSDKIEFKPQFKAQSKTGPEFQIIDGKIVRTHEIFHMEAITSNHNLNPDYLLTYKNFNEIFSEGTGDNLLKIINTLSYTVIEKIFPHIAKNLDITNMDQCERIMDCILEASESFPYLSETFLIDVVKEYGILGDYIRDGCGHGAEKYFKGGAREKDLRILIEKCGLMIDDVDYRLLFTTAKYYSSETIQLLLKNTSSYLKLDDYCVWQISELISIIGKREDLSGPVKRAIISTLV